jgi:subtilisin family serine protease
MTTTGNLHVTYSGTSMATPYVAGLLANIWSLNPTYSSNMVRRALYAQVNPRPRPTRASLKPQALPLCPAAPLLSCSTQPNMWRHANTSAPHTHIAGCRGRPQWDARR